MNQFPPAFWSISVAEMLQKFETAKEGLLSFFLHEPVDAFIILSIIFASGLLGFWQERSATNAVEKLLAIVQVKAAVLQDGHPKKFPSKRLCPGIS